MAQIRRRRGQRKISAWSKGEKRNAQGLTLKDIGRAQMRLINRGRARLKKCSAMAKSTGEQCGQLAMANGKCRFHGGRTPSGDNWHVVQPDVSGHKTSMARFDRKLNKIEQARKARRIKLMLATEAEREAYERWLWARPAGSADRRAARRAEGRMRRRLAEEKRELALGARLETATPEIEIMRARTATLKRLTALLASAHTGVFE